MARARVFQYGNSQAVCLPQNFHLSMREVEIFRRGDEIVLRERRESLAERLARLPPLPADFPDRIPDALADADAAREPTRAIRISRAP